MRTLALLAVVAVVGCGKAPSPPSAAADTPAPRVGRLAPPVLYQEFLHGDPLPGLEPGKVTVLDFWASWCGPCIQAMPHLQQVADEYAGRATVVGVTALDSRNPVAGVIKVLGVTKASQHAVRHATIDPATIDAYAIRAYPTCVVIGADGRVAYIGSPLLVDEVIPRLLAGTWEGAKSAIEVEKLADDLMAIYSRAGKEPAKGVDELAAFAAAHPDTAGRVPFRVARVAILAAAGRHDEAKSQTEALLPLLVERKDGRNLDDLRAVWVNPKGNPKRLHAGLGVRAAEGLAAVEGADEPGVLARLADAHLFAGDKAKARELADQALAAAPADSPLAKGLAELRKQCE